MNQIMQINNEGGELPQALLPSGALSLELRSAPAKESARRCSILFMPSQQKGMGNTGGVAVLPNDLACLVCAEGKSRYRVGVVNRKVPGSVPQKSMELAVRVQMNAYGFPLRINIPGVG